MGNTNSHVDVGERRKSYGLGSTDNRGVARAATSAFANSPINTIGPVDITRPHTTKNVRDIFSEFKKGDANAKEHQQGLESQSVGMSSPADDVTSCQTDGQSKAPKFPVIFRYDGSAKDVYLCGSFNDWKPLPMSKSTKDFVSIIDLEEGVHEYKFFVDGQYVMDTLPGSQTVRSTSAGKEMTNNIVYVDRQDYDAFAALDMDNELTKGKRVNAADVFPDKFGTVVPSVEAFRQFRLPGRSDTCGPPLLPPHLLQVILNKDTPLSCEPTLLPEPDRVMLNHLYALSIRDNVMVLSSTQRYRKKYVTTLLYKPMPTAAPQTPG